MDKLSKAIKCTICSSILDSPVLLPCGHSICKSHVQAGTNIFVICLKCESKHKIPKEGFLENISLAEIIAIQIQKISLGEFYEKAKRDTENLKPLIKQVDAILTDYPSNQMNKDIEEIEDMKNQVDLRREELKLKIDQEAEKMINKLDEYVVRFNDYLSGQQNQMKTNQLVDSKKSVQKALDGFENRLNEIIIDDNLWKTISQKATSEYTRLAVDLEGFKKSFIFTDLDDLKQHTAFIRNLDINFDFQSNSLLMNSQIIDPNCLKYDLMRLCEFPLCQKWQPLYRGSENKFNWNEFHAKCDSKSPTLLIVKSKDGGIFGGYTETQWNDPNPHINKRREMIFQHTPIKKEDFIYWNGTNKSLSKFKYDPSAFLFVFKYPNERKNEKPVKALLTEPKYAIYCDSNDGPSFGKFDLVIQGNQGGFQLGSDCFFNIGPSYKVLDNRERVTNLQMNRFDLEDIEIFQKI